VVTGNCKGMGYGGVHWVDVACGQIQQWVVLTCYGGVYWVNVACGQIQQWVVPTCYGGCIGLMWFVVRYSSGLC
jgi:hypothetical protein